MQLCDARGNRALAARLCERFLALWKDCDPELRPFTTDARIRLALQL